ncbi:hypothetical protein BS732_3823 [Bacillus subtilis MB73/2]|nr:hypothetical protein BS732_3823 [Bacillus subtilis MB73/2]
MYIFCFCILDKKTVISSSSIIILYILFVFVYSYFIFILKSIYLALTNPSVHTKMF